MSRSTSRNGGKAGWKKRDAAYRAEVREARREKRRRRNTHATMMLVGPDGPLHVAGRKAAAERRKAARLAAEAKAEKARKEAAETAGVAS